MIFELQGVGSRGGQAYDFVLDSPAKPGEDDGVLEGAAAGSARERFSFPEHGRHGEAAGAARAGSPAREHLLKPEDMAAGRVELSLQRFAEWSRSDQAGEPGNGGLYLGGRAVAVPELIGQGLVHGVEPHGHPNPLGHARWPARSAASPGIR